MALKASDVNVGDVHEEQVVKNLSRTQIVQYAGASGDYNPLHSDEVFTTKMAGWYRFWPAGRAFCRQSR
jgi:acyl dehydratase